MNVQRFTKRIGVGLSSLLIGCLLAMSIIALASPVSAALPGALVATRNLPATVVPGETFDVTVTFTSPGGIFNNIGFGDEGPGVTWIVTVTASKISPVPSITGVTANKPIITWFGGPYAAGTAFTACYQVTVPGDATPGVYDFSNGIVKYTLGDPAVEYEVPVTGDYQVEILPPQPDIAVTPTSKNFGSLDVGVTSPAQTFTVRNDGDANLEVGTITLIGTGAAHFSILNDNASGATIAPMGSETLQVTFRPLSEGLKTAQLSIPSNDPDEDPLTVSLQGTGKRVVGCNQGSINVAFIPGPDGPGGGTLPTEDSAFDDFNFTNLPFGSVSSGTLAEFDTIVLISCDPLNDLSSSQRTALADWLSDGGKLIIYDSECVDHYPYNPTTDYTWLPCGFESYGPGGWGADADSETWVNLEIVEDNTLSDRDSGSSYFIDTYMIAHDTDGAGDMNVFVSKDPCWCADMEGTNAIDPQGNIQPPGTTGFVHAYSHQDQGLMIYNGLDIDWLDESSNPYATTGEGYLAKIWLLELQQPWGGGQACGLPCGVRIGGELECDFEADPTRGAAPLTVRFFDLTTGGDVDSWLWDFGDGRTSRDQDPRHTYMMPGRYDVTLEVSSDVGDCEITIEGYINVLPAVTTEEGPNLAAAYLFITPDQGYPGQEFEISINVGNDGGSTGTRSIALYIDGELEQSQTVSVSAGASKLLVFRVTKYEPGTYQVLLEGNEGQFTVIKQADAKYFPGPLSTPGIIVIVVVAVVLIGAIVFVFLRRS